MAISPVAILSILVLLASRRAGVNGALFAAGWVVTVAVVAGVLAAVVRTLDARDRHPAWIAVLELTLGVAFPLRSRSVLARARGSLVRHETTVLILLCVAIAAAFLADGARALP